MASSFSSWDPPTLNLRHSDLGPSMSNSCIPDSSNSNMISTPHGRVFTSAPPPPVPARPNQNNLNYNYNSYSSSPFNGFGGYSSPYNSYGGFGGYGGYGGFGGYGFGGYRSGFGPYSYGSGGYYSNYLPENRFIQMAEESSRPILESVQSLLHTFSSVTMMFESSFQAIYSSYMSVVGVAANFGKIRSLFGQIFSGLAIIRTLKWIFRKLLYMLGITSEDYLKESAWSDAFNDVKNGNQKGGKTNKKQSWPLLVVMGMIIGGPYLLFRLMSKLNPDPVPAIWKPQKCPGSLAVALYDFQAASDQELSFSAQQRLMIAPNKYQPFDCPGWLLACNSQQKIGLVPNNYVGIFVQSNRPGETLVECNGQRFPYPEKNLTNTVPVFQTPTDNSRSIVEMENYQNKKGNQVIADNGKERTLSSDEHAKDNEINDNETTIVNDS